MITELTKAQDVMQGLFNTAVEGLNKQKQFSYASGAGCLYRSPTGNKCAVGFCISDEKYDPDFEGVTAHTGMLEQYSDDDDVIDTFIGDMQKVLHDVLAAKYLKWDQEAFEANVAHFAKKWELDVPDVF